jgi:hypothetical protein
MSISPRVGASAARCLGAGGCAPRSGCDGITDFIPEQDNCLYWYQK